MVVINLLKARHVTECNYEQLVGPEYRYSAASMWLMSMVEGRGSMVGRLLRRFRPTHVISVAHVIYFSDQPFIQSRSPSSSDA